MPGRTPSEAFRAFIEPIQGAASCLGRVKIVASPGGKTEPGKVHSWALNGPIGVAFSGTRHFEAQMHYEFHQGAVSKDWKVRTLGYRYRFAIGGDHLWRLHWHPTVRSTYNNPHAHLRLSGEGQDALNQHMPTGRMTFEDAIEWVLNAGVTPARDDWRDVLSESRDLHVKHRTWSDQPPGVISEI